MEARTRGVGAVLALALLGACGSSSSASDANADGGTAPIDEGPNPGAVCQASPGASTVTVSGGSIFKGTTNFYGTVTLPGPLKSSTKLAFAYSSFADSAVGFGNSLVGGEVPAGASSFTFAVTDFGTKGG